MASVTHSTVATLPDQPGVEINKAEWNDDHVLSGIATDTDLAALSNAISAEASSRTAADDLLSNAVSAVQANVNTVSNAVSNETSARIAADNALSNSISSATSVLQNGINVVSNALSNEISNRVSAVGAVQTNINTVSNAVSAETGNRISADNALSNSISNVNSVLQNGINVVSNALSNEISNRISADNALSTAISNLNSNMLSAVAQRKMVVNNQTTVSTSGLANISGLSFAVTNGRTYAFKFYILYTASATTSGLGVSVTTPSLTRLSAVAEVPSGADPSTSLLVSGQIRASAGRVNAVSTPATTTQMACIDGIITPSADGTLQAQGAPAVTGNNIVFQSGSTGMMWRIN